MSILIIDDTPVAETKERTVTIYKQKVYDDIDALTYKYAEARPERPPQTTNATASDTAESLDGHILARHVEFRDAKLRRLVAFALDNDTEVTSADDEMELAATFVYNFVVSTKFKDNLIQPLTDHIHRFLVWGALYDWYGASLGSEQAAWYRDELKELESEIRNMLRVPSLSKRPMQPFGPAEKIY